MNCGQLETTTHENVRVVPVEPDVKSAETRKLFNAGVSGNAKDGKSVDPICYIAPVSETQEHTVMNEREVRIFFQDEAPRIGCGLRKVRVREGEKYAYLTDVASGRTQRLPIGLFDQIEESQETSHHGA